MKRPTQPIKGFGVDMFAVAKVIVREQRLHEMAEKQLHLIVKIDGRPFGGNYSIPSLQMYML